MFKKVLDVLGFKDESDRVSSVRDIRNRQNLKRPVSATGPKARDSRMERLKQPLLMSGSTSNASLIVVRGSSCVFRLLDIKNAIEAGKMVLLDLQGLAIEDAKTALESVCEALDYLKDSTVMRINRSTFLAVPDKTAVDDWSLDRDDDGFVSEESDDE